MTNALMFNPLNNEVMCLDKIITALPIVKYFNHYGLDDELLETLRLLTGSESIKSTINTSMLESDLETLSLILLEQLKFTEEELETLNTTDIAERCTSVKYFLPIEEHEIYTSFSPDESLYSKDGLLSLLLIFLKGKGDLDPDVDSITASIDVITICIERILIKLLFNGYNKNIVDIEKSLLIAGFYHATVDGHKTLITPRGNINYA